MPYKNLLLIVMVMDDKVCCNPGPLGIKRDHLWQFPNTYFVLLLPLICAAKVPVLSMPLDCGVSVLALE